MKRIKVIYRTIHGDIAFAYRKKGAKPVFFKVSETNGYMADIWTGPNGQKLIMPRSSWPRGTKFIEENDPMFQTFMQKVKEVLLWIVAPLALVAGGIIYLLTRNKALQNQVTELKSTQEVSKDEITDEQTTTKATTSLDAYRSLRQQYLDSKSKKPSA